MFKHMYVKLMYLGMNVCVCDVSMKKVKSEW